MKAITGTDILEAGRRLANGQLVALPTETVYGLGANALNTVAVAKIFSAKDRPSFDPLILHQSSPKRILRYAREVPESARRLSERCWPGPLTLVLPRTRGVPDLVTAGLDTVALRVPDHPLTAQVLAAVDFPVAAPSANPFGYVSPVTADHVARQLGDRIDYILDGGPCTVGLESTIVGFPAGVPTVLRKGGIPLERLEEILGHPLAVRIHGSSRPAAPGMLSRHYSPGVKMRIVDRARREGTPTSAVVRFGAPARNPNEYALSETEDLAEAARRLFTILRKLGDGGYAEATVERVPDVGLGRAINDRLLRASR